STLAEFALACKRTRLVLLVLAGLAACTRASAQNLPPVWSEMKVLPQPNDFVRFVQSMEQSQLLFVWRTAYADALGYYFKALVASDPRCRPGNLITAYRFAALAGLEVDDPSVDDPSRVPDSRRERLNLLSAKDVVSLTTTSRADPHSRSNRIGDRGLVNNRFARCGPFFVLC